MKMGTAKVSFEADPCKDFFRKIISSGQTARPKLSGSLTVERFVGFVESRSRIGGLGVLSVDG